MIVNRAVRGVGCSEMLGGTQYGRPFVASLQSLVTLMFSELLKGQAWLCPAQLQLTGLYIVLPATEHCTHTLRHYKVDVSYHNR